MLHMSIPRPTLLSIYVHLSNKKELQGLGSWYALLCRQAAESVCIALSGTAMGKISNHGALDVHTTKVDWIWAKSQRTVTEQVSNWGFFLFVFFTAIGLQLNPSAPVNCIVVALRQSIVT